MSPIFFFCKEILMKQCIEGIHNFCSSVWLFRLAAPSSKLSKWSLILWAVCIHAVFYSRLIKSHFASYQIVCILSSVRMIKTLKDASNQTQSSNRNWLLLSTPRSLANLLSIAKMKSTSRCMLHEYLKWCKADWMLYACWTKGWTCKLWVCS